MQSYLMANSELESPPAPKIPNVHHEHSSRAGALIQQQTARDLSPPGGETIADRRAILKARLAEIDERGNARRELMAEIGALRERHRQKSASEHASEIAEAGALANRINRLQDALESPELSVVSRPSLVAMLRRCNRPDLLAEWKAANSGVVWARRRLETAAAELKKLDQIRASGVQYGADSQASIAGRHLEWSSELAAAGERLREAQHRYDQLDQRLED